MTSGQVDTWRERLVFKRALTALERLRVLDYMRVRHGIAAVVTFAVPSGARRRAKQAVVRAGLERRRARMRRRPPARTSMIFTFGFGHECSCGLSLRSCFVEMPSRDAMVERYGIKWAHEYDTREDAGVERFELLEVKPGDECGCGGLGRKPWDVEHEERELARKVFGGDDE